MDPRAQLEPEYEIIIVGGRPAGASLASRLGARGVHTLVFDKAVFPSQPSVPSCAVLYPQTLELLDELGVDERDYGDDSAMIRRFILQIPGQFHAKFSMIEAFGRDHLCGIDRSHFDAAVWSTLDRHPSVTARNGLCFIDFLRDDDGRVAGARVRDQEGNEHSIRARAVVGADGRFSSVARKAGARVLEDFADRTSTAHFATWENVAPFDDDPRVTAHVYTSARGTDVLFFPTLNSRTTVCTHVRSDRAKIDGDATAFYLRTVKAFPEAWSRLEHATRCNDVVGLRKVANRYLEPGGPGWVLVGDALHHKDPVDGQGIYDALLESKLLDEELAAWQAGTQGWDDMVASYDRRVREGTHGMFMATMERLRRELYEEPPTLVIKTLMRWLLNDLEYQQRFLSFLCRLAPPDRWLTPGLMGRAVLRGMLGDLGRVFGRSKAA